MTADRGPGDLIRVRITDEMDRVSLPGFSEWMAQPPAVSHGKVAGTEAFHPPATPIVPHYMGNLGRESQDPHRHVIREDLPTQVKKAMAKHIDDWHSPKGSTCRSCREWVVDWSTHDCQ